MVAEATELLLVARGHCCSWISVTAFTVFSCRPDVTTVLNVVASIQRVGLKYRRFAPA